MMKRMKVCNVKTVMVTHTQDHLLMYAVSPTDAKNVVERNKIMLLDHRVDRILVYQSPDGGQADRDQLAFYLLGIQSDKEAQKAIKKMLGVW